MNRSDVFDYLNYREFIRDMVEYIKASRKLTVRSVTGALGFRSSSYLKMVVDGKRNLKPETVYRFTRGFQLNGAEASFFEVLVRFNQSMDLEEKNELFKKLLSHRRFREVKRTIAAQYQYFSNWVVVAVLEGLGTPWAKKSVRAMAKDLGVEESEVRSAFETLAEMQLIVKKHGLWQRTDNVIESPPELHNLQVRNYYAVMNVKAAESLDRDDSSERDFGGLTIALSKKGFMDLKRRLFKLKQDISVIHSKDPNPDTVYQIVTQAFPLFKIKQGDD